MPGWETSRKDLEIITYEEPFLSRLYRDGYGAGEWPNAVLCSSAIRLVSGRWICIDWPDRIASDR